LLASYSTLYSGSYDRIRNLQLAVQALDGTLVPPGGTFSFNRAVGPRTEERGYRPAPVIVNGEYEDGVGGGVSQVATTMFNAAWEAGVKITGRTAHALYISRYPLGRDATVVYPEIDVKFRNDTPRHIYVQATYGESGIAISLLGAGRERQVVSRAGELRDVAPPKTKLVPDPNLFEGEKVVEDAGEPARAVTVSRTVYIGDKVLYDEQWSTYYRSEPKIVRVGTKPKPAEEEPATTTTTTTGATTTGPAPTTTAPG
jgi:vancomycin resistance protein YoaR